MQFEITQKILLTITGVVCLAAFFFGFNLISSGRKSPYFRIRQRRITQGWQMIGFSVVLGLIFFLIFNYWKSATEIVFPPTPTPTLTATITLTPSLTPLPSATKTVSPSPTSSQTLPPGVKPSWTPTITNTPLPTKTPSNTRTPFPRDTPTRTPPFTSTMKPSLTPAPANTHAPTPTITPSRTIAPTSTMRVYATRTPVITPTKTLGAAAAESFRSPLDRLSVDLQGNLAKLKAPSRSISFEWLSGLFSGMVQATILAINQYF